MCGDHVLWLCPEACGCTHLIHKCLRSNGESIVQKAWLRRLQASSIEVVWLLWWCRTGMDPTLFKKLFQGLWPPNLCIDERVSDHNWHWIFVLGQALISCVIISMSTVSAACGSASRLGRIRDLPSLLRSGQEHDAHCVWGLEQFGSEKR